MTRCEEAGPKAGAVHTRRPLLRWLVARVSPDCAPFVWRPFVRFSVRCPLLAMLLANGYCPTFGALRDHFSADFGIFRPSLSRGGWEKGSSSPLALGGSNERHADIGAKNKGPSCRFVPGTSTSPGERQKWIQYHSVPPCSIHPGDLLFSQNICQSSSGVVGE